MIKSRKMSFLQKKKKIVTVVFKIKRYIKEINVVKIAIFSNTKIRLFVELYNSFYTFYLRCKVITLQR